MILVCRDRLCVDAVIGGTAWGGGGESLEMFCWIAHEASWLKLQAQYIYGGVVSQGYHTGGDGGGRKGCKAGREKPVCLCRSWRQQQHPVNASLGSMVREKSGVYGARNGESFCTRYTR